MIEELPLRRGARGLQQRLKSSAGKIRSRFKNIQKPTFTMPHMPHRQAKSEKPTTVTTTTITATTTEKPPASPRPADQKASRMERFRMALPERPKFSLPDKSKFHLPDRSKFHLPDRSKFHLPERPKFNIDRSKFQIKKPNIQLPKSLSRPKRSTSQRGSLVGLFGLKILLNNYWYNNCELEEERYIGGKNIFSRENRARLQTPMPHRPRVPLAETSSTSPRIPVPSSSSASLR